jgi:hypothetical protein
MTDPYGDESPSDVAPSGMAAASYPLFCRAYLSAKADPQNPGKV